MWSDTLIRGSRKLGSALNYSNLSQYLPSPAEGTGFVIRCSNTTAGAKPVTGSNSKNANICIGRVNLTHGLIIKVLDRLPECPRVAAI